MQYFNTQEKTKVIVNICNLNLMNIAGRDSVVVANFSSDLGWLSVMESECNMKLKIFQDEKYFTVHH